MDLLKFASKHFAKIDKLKSEKKWNEVYEYIDSCTPPDEWIVELPSKATKGDSYKTMPIDVMEAAVKRIFGHAWIDWIGNPIVSQDKNGRFATTVVVTYSYTSLDGHSGSVQGIATVSASDINMLELATPKASTMALKNAIKQLGGLFGKYLNRAADEADLPIEPAEEKLSPEERAANLLEQLLSCTNIADLKSYRLVVYDKKTSPDIQSLYEARLRELAKTSKVIG